MRLMSSYYAKMQRNMRAFCIKSSGNLILAPQVLRMAVVGSDFDLLLKLSIARQWQRDRSADLPCFFGPVLA